MLEPAVSIVPTRSSTLSLKSVSISERSAVNVKVPELSAISTLFPPVNVTVPPRETAVELEPSVTVKLEFDNALLPIFVIVLEDPLIVLFVMVSVEV